MTPSHPTPKAVTGADNRYLGGWAYPPRPAQRADPVIGRDRRAYVRPISMSATTITRAL